jgi:hypothetical protein
MVFNRIGVGETMNSSGKNIFFGLLAGLLAFFAFKFLFNLGNLIPLIIGLLMGAGVVIILMAKSRGEKPEDVAKEVVQQAIKPDPGANERLLNEQLIQLNEQIRMSGLDLLVIQPSEQIIDLLQELVPQAQEKSPGSETTFDLEQLAITHLPALLNKYIDLDPADRVAQQDTLVLQLTELQKKLAGLQTNLAAGQLHEFQVESQFLKQKL